MGRAAGRLLLALSSLAAAGPALADVYVLLNGDRITGKTVGRGARAFRVSTPYGRLEIPRDQVERIFSEDGREEIVTRAVLPPAATPVQMVLVVTGHTFWYAWSPAKGEDLDPSLRLQVSLDEEAVAGYVDTKLDPGEIRGATVNSFSFTPADLVITPASRVRASFPETRPGRISVRIGLPQDKAGRRRLRLAYQINSGSEAEPGWRDVAAAVLDVELRADAPAFVDVRQDRGRMSFSGLLGRKKMKNAETFTLDLRAESRE